MKTRILFILSLFCALAVIRPEVTNAQEVRSSSKQQRKAAKAAAENLEKQVLTRQVDSKNFSFIAKELTSTKNAGVAKIRLDALYGLYIRPGSFKCYLPVYGSAPSDPRPSLLRYLDFIVDEYKMEATDRKGGFKVEIQATDPRTTVKYLFVMIIPVTGRNATLTVSTNFDSPVTFTGDIRE